MRILTQRKEVNTCYGFTLPKDLILQYPQSLIDDMTAEEKKEYDNKKIITSFLAYAREKVLDFQ